MRLWCCWITDACKWIVYYMYVDSNSSSTVVSADTNLAILINSVCALSLCVVLSMCVCVCVCVWKYLCLVSRSVKLNYEHWDLCIWAFLGWDVGMGIKPVTSTNELLQHINTWKTLKQIEGVKPSPNISFWIRQSLPGVKSDQAPEQNKKVCFTRIRKYPCTKGS